MGRLFLFACVAASTTDPALTDPALVLKVYVYDRDSATWSLPDWHLIPTDQDNDVYGPCLSGTFTAQSDSMNPTPRSFDESVTGKFKVL